MTQSGRDNSKWAGNVRSVGSEEKGAMVEMRRVYLSGENWNPEAGEVRRGMLGICEEQCFSCRVRDSGWFACCKSGMTGYKFAFKVDGWFITTDGLPLDGQEGNMGQNVTAAAH